MIDWDAVVGTPCTEVFGQPMTYLRSSGAAPIPMLGNFTEGYDSQEPIGEGITMTTTRPTMGVQYSSFPTGFTPAQGDQIRTLNQVTNVLETFDIKEVQPDGNGSATLVLNLASS